MVDAGGVDDDDGGVVWGHVRVHVGGDVFGKSQTVSPEQPPSPLFVFIICVR